MRIVSVKENKSTDEKTEEEKEAEEQINRIDYAN